VPTIHLHFRLSHSKSSSSLYDYNLSRSRMSAQLSLRSATSNAASLVSAYVHKKDSYRNKLSPESLADLVIEVTKTDKPAGAAGNFSDVKVKIYSKKEYEASGEKKKKKAFKYYTPEMIFRWGNIHTIGEAHEKSPDAPVNGRKRSMSLQSHFPEKIDGELNEAMQVQLQSNRIPAYLDINEEVRWFYQQSFIFEDMVLRALYASPDCTPALKIGPLNTAKTLVAARRGLEPHEVDDIDPEVQELAYQGWSELPQIHRSLIIDKRCSEPDVCPLREKCVGLKCKHKDHVHGKKEYLIKLQSYVFSKNDQDAKLPNYGTLVLAAEWLAVNAEAALLMTPEDKKKEIDLYSHDKVISKGYHYNPVYYKTKRTLNQSWKVAEKHGIKAGYFDRMHDKQLAYGNVVRVCVRPGAAAFDVAQGVGLRFYVDCKDIVIVRGKRVECNFDEADDISTFGEEDIDFTTSIADRPMYGVETGSIGGTPFNALPSANPTTVAAPAATTAAATVTAPAATPSAAGQKRKLAETNVVQNEAKKPKYESPDVSEDEDEDGTEEPMED
jgi:hypothetical protein